MKQTFTVKVEIDGDIVKRTMVEIYDLYGFKPSKESLKAFLEKEMKWLNGSGITLKEIVK